MVKRIIIIVCILLVGLWIGSAYFDIPQLNSIRKMINLAEYSKQPIQVRPYLSIGETGINDDISITVEAVDFSNIDGARLDKRCVEYSGIGGQCIKWDNPCIEFNGLGDCIKRSTEEVWVGGRTPASGAKFFYVKIKSTNIGKLKTPYADPKKIVKLFYAGGQIPLYNQWIKSERSLWDGYGDMYPNVTTEGWLWFEVPMNINLAETTLEINGLVWKLG